MTHQRARVRTAPPVAPDVPRQEAPPPERPALTNNGPAGPVFGVTMESTSQAGSGPAMAVGHTGGAAAAGDDDDDGHGGRKGGPAPPVPAYEVTTMPLPQGRCEGKYTDEALRAAIEGTVILNVIVSETGRVRDVHVVSGLGHGLTEAAVAAVKGCRFSPGEKDGKRRSGADPRLQDPLPAPDRRVAGRPACAIAQAIARPSWRRTAK